MRVFEEKQRFTQWWIWLIHLASISSVVYAFYTYSDNTAEKDTTGLIILVVTVIAVSIFIHTIQLSTTINDSGIEYQLFPFQWNKKHLGWKALKSITTRKYNPILEYGGWGYRIGRKGKALNIKGNQGIQLELTTGKSLLIGTQKPEEAQQTITYYLQKNERI